MFKSKLLPTLFLLLVSSATITAQSAAIKISDEDKKPKIQGTLSGNTTSFSKTITIALVGGDPNQAKVLKVSKSDLREVGGSSRVIDRSNISIPAVSLTKDQRQDVTITINNVAAAGKYEGKIKFWLPEETEDAAKEVNLTLEISPKIDVKTPAAQTAQLVRCSPLPCRLARWLPTSLLGQERSLQLDNQTTNPVKVSGHGVFLLGQKTGHPVTEGDVILEHKDWTLPARQPSAITIKVSDRNRLLPDRYAGTIRFNLEGADAQSIVNYTLDVRDAPWWALLALLLGVILGRLVRSMNTPEALLQIKLLRRWHRIQNGVLSLPNEKDREALLAKLEDIRSRINAANETEQALTAELEKVESEVRFLNQLARLQRDVNGVLDPVLKADLQLKLNSARSALLRGDFTECLNQINAVIMKLREIGDSATENELAKRFNLLASSAEDVRAEAENVRTTHQTESVPVSVAKRSLSMLAGTELISANVRFWFLRPLFFLLLLIFLVLIGLKTLYIDAGSIFGSEGLYDYFGLVLWGMSAEVVQRTLQNLQLPRPT